MTDALTEQGNMACRSIANRAASSKPAGAFDRGYYQGQLGIIELYLEPDAELLSKAKAAVAAIPKLDE